LVALPGRCRRCPPPKKKKYRSQKNWTCDEVIVYARSVISAEALNNVDALPSQLDGEILLEMRQNQSLVDAVMSNGLDETVVYKLAGAVRKLVPPVRGVF